MDDFCKLFFHEENIDHGCPFCKSLGPFSTTSWGTTVILPPKGVSQFKGPITPLPAVLTTSKIYPDTQFASASLPTLLLSSVPATPSVDVPAHHLPTVPVTPFVGISAVPSSLEIQKQGRSPQFSGKPDQSRQLAHTRSQPQALHRAKIRVTIKVTLFGGTILLVGGVASFLLLHFPIYLVVSWVILIIVLSNFVSQELRSYYWLGLKMTLTTQHLPAVKLSNHSKNQKVDMGRNSMLKDIHDTAAYLKALCLLSQNNRSARTISSEKDQQL